MHCFLRDATQRAGFFRTVESATLISLLSKKFSALRLTFFFAWLPERRGEFIGAAALSCVHFGEASSFEI